MRRRHETLREKCARFQGVAIVVSVPVVLIVIVVTLMPRISPLDASQVIEDDPLNLKSKSRGSAPKSDAEKYAVIIDAGSTGSRIHVYRFNQKLELVEIGDNLELFTQIKPGLSSYSENPKNGGESLKQLLDKAVEVVPPSLRSVTPVRVGATAGLRLLPGDLAEQLLEEVRKVLKDYPFSFDDDSVKILDGAAEGSFAWLTVNYLLGNLGKEVKDSVGVIDLGGGSVQMTYAVSDATAKSAPDGEYIRKFNALGKSYNIYVHSYLGYGLMAARAEVLKLVNDGKGHSCVAKGFSGEYTYGSKTFKALALDEGSDFTSCTKLTNTALKLSEACKFDKCSFNGVWSGGGGDGVQKLFVASYFFDRATQVGIISDPSVPYIEVKPEQFKEAGSKVCSTAVGEIESKYPSVDKKDAAYLCLDVAFQYSLLTAGLGISPDSTITLVKQIEYRGKAVEAAWPLGMAISATS